MFLEYENVHYVSLNRIWNVSQLLDYRAFSLRKTHISENTGMELENTELNVAIN